MLLATHTVAAAEAMVLARHSGLDLELVQRTLDNSIAASAIWRQRGPVMRQRAWLPAPGPIDTLHSILQQIEDSAAAAGLQTPVFTSAKRCSTRQSPTGGGNSTSPASTTRSPANPPQPGSILMTWSLATYQRGDTIGLAVLREDGTAVAPPDLKRWASMLELLEDWAQAEDVLRAIEIDDAPAVDYDTLLAPVRWPRKVICAGVNYRRHICEMGGEVPGADWTPFFFLKPPTTTVIGPADAIVVRSAETARYDWEAELAVVIGAAAGTSRPRMRWRMWPATAWPTT